MTTRKPTHIRRAEISDAALHVVATMGIAALSTRVLAERVGVTTGALFKHYPSRDAILLGMAERVTELLRTTYPAPDPDPELRLARFASNRLALIKEHPGVLALVTSEQFALALPEDAARLLQDAIRETHRFVTDTITAGQDLGSLRDDVPAAALAMLLMGALQMAALARRSGAVADPSSVLDAFTVLARAPGTLENS